MLTLSQIKMPDFVEVIYLMGWKGRTRKESYTNYKYIVCSLLQTNYKYIVCGLYYKLIISTLYVFYYKMLSIPHHVTRAVILNSTSPVSSVAGFRLIYPKKQNDRNKSRCVLAVIFPAVHKPIESQCRQWK